MKPFVFDPNALVDIWRQDTLPWPSLPTPSYESVPVRLLRPYLVLGGPLAASGVNNFLHRFHIHPDIPCGEIIINNSDNAAWALQIHGDPVRLYYRIRYGSTIRNSGLRVAHYVMGFPQYRQ